MVQMLFNIHKEGKLVFDQEAEIPVRRGVPQGSPISPLLFNVYLEEAIMSSNVLKTCVQAQKLLAFADDLLLIAESTEEVKVMLKAIERWQQSLGHTINKTKTVFMSNRNDIRKINSIGWIKRETNFKYLGIRCSLNF